MGFCRYFKFWHPYSPKKKIIKTSVNGINLEEVLWIYPVNWCFFVLVGNYGIFKHFGVIFCWKCQKKLRGILAAKVPEIISAEQPCLRDLTFFSTLSEKMKSISAEQCCFRADQLWLSLNKGCSELKNSALNCAVSERIISNQLFLALKRCVFSADLIWISSDINTCRWEYQNVIM